MNINTGAQKAECYHDAARFNEKEGCLQGWGGVEMLLVGHLHPHPTKYIWASTRVYHIHHTV
jgi:hypothetical protein